MSILDPQHAGKWQRVSSSHPCPVCNKPDWCSVSADGQLVACRRLETGAWQSKIDQAGTRVHLHRLTRADSHALPSVSEVSLERADTGTLTQRIPVYLLAYFFLHPT